MPPKSSKAASSSKVQTAKGAKVTTLVSSGKAKADEPAAIWINLELAAGAKAGFDWGDSGHINRVTPGGAASKASVKPKMRLYKVNEDLVLEGQTKKEVEAMLVGAREKGPYILVFATPAAEAQAAVERAAKMEEEAAAAAVAAAEAAVLKAEEDARAAEAEAAAQAANAEAESAATIVAEAKAEEEAKLAAQAAAEAEAKAKAEALRNGKVAVLVRGPFVS
jgi:hypothetical protein